MIQPTYRRDIGSAFFKRGKDPGQFIIRTCLVDLIVIRIHPVGEVDENASSWPGQLLGGPERLHTVQQWQRDGDAKTSQNMPAIHTPVL